MTYQKVTLSEFKTALVSGDFPQCTKHFRRPVRLDNPVESFCGLGVGMELFRRKNKDNVVWDEGRMYMLTAVGQIDYDTGCVDMDDWLDCTTDERDALSQIVSHNDNGYTFEEITGMIPVLGLAETLVHIDTSELYKLPVVEEEKIIPSDVAKATI